MLCERNFVALDHKPILAYEKKEVKYAPFNTGEGKGDFYIVVFSVYLGMWAQETYL